MADAEEREPRSRRSSRSADRRLIVVDAFVDLVLENGSAPTPDSVADRAGVSRATLFRYFATLAELRNEAAARVIERFPDLFTLPTTGEGSPDERIRRFVDVELQLHEKLHPLELLTRSHVADTADTVGFVNAVRQLQADQIRAYFAADLERCPSARRDDIVLAVGVLTSVESWQQYRQTFGRSPAQTRRAWRTALAGVLAAASPS